MKIDWEIYKRRFVHPIQVSHQIWEFREGVLLRLRKSSGQVGWGEIAPIEWFGTESMSQVLDYMESLGPTIDMEDIQYIPNQLRCVQCGFHTALAMLNGAQWWSATPRVTIPVAALLPSGKSAIDALGIAIAKGYRAFKWKIGITSVDKEQEYCASILKKMGPQTTLHLDANGGLCVDALRSWCDFSKDRQIDYIEQGLPPGQEELMREIQLESGVPMALDESILGWEQLRTQSKNYPEAIFTLKPSLLGNPKAIIDWRKHYPKHRCVYSSAFETAIGFEMVLRIAAADPMLVGAHGLSTGSYLPNDQLKQHQNVPLYEVGRVNEETFNMKLFSL